MEEIWKDVKGFEGLYEISSFGRVKNSSNHIKKLRLFKNGYLYVGLWNKGASKTLLVHRLVAKHFILNIDNKKQVNHKDGNKLNNSMNNLEWCSDKENKRHAVKTGLFHTGKKHYMSKKVLDESTGIVYDSVKIASKELNINYSTIRAYLNGGLTNKTKLKYINQ